MALNVRKSNELLQKNIAMQDIAQKHGLIFFFRSDCPYCHAIAKVLKQLEYQYGVEVIAASIDGGGLPEYPYFKDGRNLAESWGVSVVPALFIADKNTADHAPVGYGAMALEEIVDRMYQLTSIPVGEGF